MKKFILKCLVFISLLILINLLISCFLPQWYGNPYLAAKLEILKKNKDKNYNTFFIGSSRFFRSMDPKYFDENAKASIKIRSYNLATHGTSSPECLFVYEALLNQKDLKIKYAFLEIDNLELLGKKLYLHTMRMRYWLNMKYLNYSIKVVLYSHKSKLKKIQRYYHCLISYIERIINLELYQGLKNDYYKDFTAYSKYYLENTKTFNNTNEFNGFIPNDRDTDIQGVEGRKLFLADPAFNEYFKKVKRISSKQFAHCGNLGYNKIYFNKIMSLIEKSKMRGVHLIMVVSPQIENYSEIIPILKKLPDENKIELANSDLYPELYLPENTFLPRHLNGKGAEVFTKLLAEKFNKIVK